MTAHTVSRHVIDGKHYMVNWRGNDAAMIRVRIDPTPGGKLRRQFFRELRWGAQWDRIEAIAKAEGTDQ